MPNAAGFTYQPHIKCQFGGALAAGGAEDIWSNSVNFHSGGTPFQQGFLPPADQLRDMLPGIRDALFAWIGSQNSFISAAAQLNFIKLNVIGEDGKQRDLNTVSMMDLQQSGATGGPAAKPWQVTWALTLRSDTFTRGRGHSGRIYPPAVCAPMDNLGAYTTFPAALLMASEFGTCLNAMAQAITDVAIPGGVEPNTQVYHPIIVSPGNTAKGQTGFNPNIDRVVCDRVPDIQRRRVNAVPRSEGAPFLIAGA